MFKKIIAAILASVMILSTACSAPAEEATGTSDAAETPSSDAATTEDSGETYEVTMYVHGDASQRMQEFLDNEFIAEVEAAINVVPNVQFLPWSEYASGKNETMHAAGEKFMTQTDTNYMNKSISKGYLADLTDSMANYGQNILEYCGQSSLDAFQSQGRQYAIPFGNKPNSGQDYMFAVRQDLLESVGMTEITSFEDLEEFYTLASAQTPGILGYSRGVSVKAFLGGIDSDINVYLPYSFMMTDGNKPDDTSVSNFYASDEYRQVSEITSDWVEKGIIPSYILSNKEQAIAEFNNGNALFCTGASYRTFEYNNIVRQVVPEAIFRNYYIGDKTQTPWMTRGNYSTAWQVGAAVEGEELDAYVKLMDLLQSDIKWNDMMLYGIEGVDFQINDDGAVEKLVSDAFFDSYIPDNVNFKRYDDYITEDMITEFENWDDGAILQKDVGFAFDPSPVSVELAQISAVEEEFISPITNGLLDYESNIDEALSRLEEAGIQKFMDEYERQFTEFLNSK